MPASQIVPRPRPWFHFPAIKVSLSPAVTIPKAVGVRTTGCRSRVVRLEQQISLGQGAAVYAQAVEAMRHWQMFNLGWCRHVTCDGQAAYPGQVFGVVSRTFPVSVTNLGAVEQVVRSEGGEVGTFTIVCATSQRNMLIGKERFAIRFAQASQEVTFRIRSWSAIAFPFLPLTPVIRGIQRRFLKDAAESLRRSFNTSANRTECTAHK